MGLQRWTCRLYGLIDERREANGILPDYASGFGNWFRAFRLMIRRYATTDRVRDRGARPIERAIRVLDVAPQAVIIAPREQSPPPPSPHFHDNARQSSHTRHAAFHPFSSSGLMPFAFREAMTGRSVKGTRDPSQGQIADVLALYGKVKAGSQSRPKETAGRISRLLEFFGDRVLGDVNGDLCRAYVAQRLTDAAARRELAP